MTKRFRNLKLFEDVNFDQSRFDAAITLCTVPVRTMIEVQIAADGEAKAADAASYERHQTLQSELGEAKRQRALHQRETDRQPTISADDERRAERLQVAVDRAQRRLDDFMTKKGKQRRVPQMLTSRIQAEIAKRVRAPQRSVQIEIPKAYKACDPADGIARARKEILEKDARKRAFIDAPLPIEDASRRLDRDWRRKRDGTTDAALKELFRVHQADDGRLREEAVEIPDGMIWRAIEPHVLAHGRRRLQDIWERFEFDNVEAISMRDRKLEIQKIDSEIANLENLEGHFIRQLAIEGREFDIRPEMSIAALLGQEPDPDAEENDEAA